MPEPGSLAGLSGVEKAEKEVSELKTKLENIADEITALKTKLKKGASILKDKTEAPWTCEKLDSKLPDEEYDVVWTEEDCPNPLGKFVAELKAEIAKKEDKEKDLTALLPEKEKQVTEEKKQVTAEKEKELVEAQARQGAGVGNKKYVVGAEFDNGAACIPLRRLIHEKAVQMQARNLVTQYGREDELISPSSVLAVRMEFRKEKDAWSMEESLRKLAAETFNVGIRKGVWEEEGECSGPPVKMDEYHNDESPDRSVDLWDLADLRCHTSESTSVSTTVLSEEIVRRECLICATGFDKIEWAHIKEKFRCNEKEKKDPSNRLVLDNSLHVWYDGRNSNRTPAVTFFCQETDDALRAREARGGWKKMEITVVFAVAEEAERYIRKVKVARQLSKTSFVCTIEKENPVATKQYLNARYRRDAKKMGIKQTIACPEPRTSRSPVSGVAPSAASASRGFPAACELLTPHRVPSRIRESSPATFSGTTTPSTAPRKTPSSVRKTKRARGGIDSRS